MGARSCVPTALTLRNPTFVLKQASWGIPCYHYPMTNGSHLNWIASNISGLADDLLRDVSSAARSTAP